MRLLYECCLQDLPTNIRLMQKWLTVKKDLAYYNMELKKAVKSFIVQATCECVRNILFGFVIGGAQQ